MSLFTPKISVAEHDQAIAEIREDYRAELDDMRTELAEATQMAAATDWFSSILTKRVLVHTKADQSIEGSLAVEQPSDGILLRAARLLDDPSKPTSIAGEVFIPRENVAFAQFDE